MDCIKYANWPADFSQVSTNLYTSNLLSRTCQFQGRNYNVSVAACSTNKPRQTLPGSMLLTLLLFPPFHSHTPCTHYFWAWFTAHLFQEEPLLELGLIGLQNVSSCVPTLKHLHNMLDLVKKWGAQMPQPPESSLFKEPSWKPENGGRSSLFWILQFITNMDRLEF